MILQAKTVRYLSFKNKDNSEKAKLLDEKQLGFVFILLFSFLLQWQRENRERARRNCCV